MVVGERRKSGTWGKGKFTAHARWAAAQGILVRVCRALAIFQEGALDQCLHPFRVGGTLVLVAAFHHPTLARIEHRARVKALLVG